VKVELTESRTGNCSTFATLRKEQAQGLTRNPNESLFIPSRPDACFQAIPLHPEIQAFSFAGQHHCRIV
jgi:hypothetical protein